MNRSLDSDLEKDQKAFSSKAAGAFSLLVRILYPLITVPYLIRTLQPDGAGRAVLAVSLAACFILAAQLGLTYYGAQICKKDNTALGELLLVRILTVIAAAFIYLIVILAVPGFRQAVSLYLICGMGILFTIPECGWIYEAAGDTAFPAIASAAVRIVSAVLLFAFVRDPGDIRMCALICVILPFAANILSFLGIHRFLEISPLESMTGPLFYSGGGGVVPAFKAVLKKHIRPLIVFTAMAFTIEAYFCADTVMLGFIKDTGTAGMYAAVFMLFFVLIMVSLAAGGGSPRRSAGIATGITLPLAVFILLFAGLWTGLLTGNTGNAGSDAAMALRILMLAAFPAVCGSIINTQVLIPGGYEKDVLKIHAAGFAANLICAAVLIPVCGPAGAAVSAFAVSVLLMLLGILFLKKRSGEKIFSVRDIARSCFVCCISGTIAYFILRGITMAAEISGGTDTGSLPMPFTVLRLVLAAVIFWVVYVLLMLLFNDEFYWNCLGSLRKKRKK